MSTQTATGLQIKRALTSPDISPLESLEWETRDARITDSKNVVVFEQLGVRVPKSWSQTALNIVASKYLHGNMASDTREKGVDDLVLRVSNAIHDSGVKQGYFCSTEDASIFHDELVHLLLNQYAAFNSPVWFNVGCAELEPDNNSKNWHWSDEIGDGVVRGATGYRNPQCSACFINSVQDSMESILDLAKTEGMLFKWGSGSGSNLSAIRASKESLSGGGTSSGPLSFMRGFDAFAGVIKSGGKTRRAAKMVILNVDHPDIEEFIVCKAKEEEKAKTLVAAGYDGSGPDSEAYSSIFYQNANNSVRVTDEFMELASSGKPSEWPLIARTTGAVVSAVDAGELLHKLSKATWDAGDPGMQFDTAINTWHTCPESGRINASNPCSEYMFLDDSACNLASLNLLLYAQQDGSFNVNLFLYHVRLLIITQHIEENGTIEGAIGVLEEHLPIFDCALKPEKGNRTITWRGHVDMMAAVQPFLSGAISKTVNMPAESTVEDISKAYIWSWQQGLKAIAIYRDGSKSVQVISVSKDEENMESKETQLFTTVIESEELKLQGPPKADRQRLPSERRSITHKFGIAGHEGYITAGLYPNHDVGEIFIRMAKEGSTISGLMDSLATAVSLGLQSGVPLKAFCDKFTHTRFEPSGWTGNEQFGYATSLVDYIFRWLELRFLKGEQLDLYSGQSPLATHAEVPLPPQGASSNHKPLLDHGDAPNCTSCGELMRRAGKCFSCSCGQSSGCS